jgi:hypothetical protein
MRKVELIAVLAALAVATPAMAQQGRGRMHTKVPPGHMPPAGMCRIWIDGVPPGQQPAATDCTTAAARVPVNGRIIYGDRTDRSSRSIYDSNGDIVRRGDQRCAQRVDIFGRVQTICPDVNRDDRISSGVYTGDQRELSTSKAKGKGKSKIKHGKPRGDDFDRDEDYRRR